MEKNPVKELGQDVQQYVQVQTELLKLQLVNKMAGAASSVVISVVIALVAFLCVIFLSISLGLWLSDLLGSYTKGFLAVGLILLFKLIVLAFFSKVLIGQPLRNKIISSALAEKEVEDED